MRRPFRFSVVISGKAVIVQRVFLGGSRSSVDRLV